MHTAVKITIAARPHDCFAVNVLSASTGLSILQENVLTVERYYDYVAGLRAAYNSMGVECDVVKVS